ncbi:hypothetical protein COV11_03850 [Candidatus Woesearchaeota archaeon CG10_big_fil_rev_8_21_14_0_10_30_7]|nr:MAG: hypothetical protein COV11_03850 [Candidatus Woesearchaeota archaeon CG10_big_fil_rev_8_21_14_0_10_30_7]
MKIGWFMYGPKRVPGSRIQGWNMHDYLLSKGIDSNIIFAQEGYNTNFNFSKKQINNFLKKFYDMIIVHKIETGKNFYYFINQAHKKGMKVIFIGLDSFNVKFASICDGILVVSKYLQNIILKKYRKKTYFIFDGYEHDGKNHKKHSNKKKIKLVFITTNLHKKFPYIDELPKNVNLTVISHPKKRLKMFAKHGISYSEVFPETKFKFNYVEWNLKTVEDEILKCDVAVIPVPGFNKEEYVKKKSSNRLILFMSLGLPTIASPIAEYKPLIKQGKNGFLAKNSEEWIKYIEYLRDNPSKRKITGNHARKDIVPKYSKEAQGELYLKIFKKILKQK